MKKVTLVFALAFALTFQSCATIMGGPITEHQANRPGPGEPPRQVRAGAMIANVLLFWPGVFIDLATGAAYKPLESERVKLTGAEMDKQWEQHRTHLKARQALRKIERAEGKDGFTYEQVITMDSLRQVMNENPRIK